MRWCLRIDLGCVNKIRPASLPVPVFYTYNFPSQNMQYLKRRGLSVLKQAAGSVADPDPGSGAFLPQGSGIRIRDDFFPDLGSRILTTS
jgi:hypothetical protein